MFQFAVFLVLISTAWARPDFIEAQMTIDQGRKPACSWNSQEDL